MDCTEKTIEQKIVFEGRVFTAYHDTIELPNGKPAKREIVKHNGGVAVVALNEKNEIYFVRQFRYPYKEMILEIPAGKLEINEEPFEAMKREQREETGTVAEKYISLGELYPTPGYCSEILYIWACRVSAYVEMDLDEDEFLNVELIPMEKAFEMVMNGEIKDAKTQMAILKTKVLVDKGML